MKFIIVLGVFFFATNAYFSNASPLSLFEMGNLMQQNLGDDRQECAKKAVEAVANEDSGNIGDFHEKSDFEKMKTLHKESLRMMRNGNKGWRQYARLYSIMEEELGGERDFMDSYFGNYTTELAKGTLNSTLICTVLANTKPFYESAKEAIGNTVGSSDKFWPMVKDMMTSVDLEHKDIREAPTVFFAVANIMTFGLPKDLMEMMTQAMESVSEETFRQKIREMGPSLRPFPFNNQG